MNGLFKIVLEDKITKWGMLLSCIFLTIALFIIALFYTSLPPLLPLFNQLPWGESRLGAKIEIFIPIMVAAAFMVFNTIALSRLYQNTPLLSRILSITTLLGSLLSFIFTIRTVFLLI